MTNKVVMVVKFTLETTNEAIITNIAVLTHLTAKMVEVWGGQNS